MSMTHAQCLLFVVDDGPTNLLSPFGRLSSAATVPSPAPKAYALVSEVFSEERPEVLALFEPCNIRILSNENASSLAVLGKCWLNIFELLFEESPSASLDPLSTITNPFDSAVITLLLRNLTVCFINEGDITSVRPAVDDKNFEAVKHLLHKAVTLCSYQKELLLYLAARRGPECLLRLLLKHRAKVQWNDNATPLPIAHVGFARFFVPRIGSTTVLHIAAKNGHAPTVRLLITHGIPVNGKDVDRQTALHVASKKGHLDIVKILLHSGILVDHKDSNGHTALYYAAKRGHLDVVETLVHNGANVKSMSVHPAVSCGHREVVDTLLKYGAQIRDRDSEDSSLLSTAFMAESSEVFQYLLENHFLNLELLKETQIVEVVVAKMHKMNRLNGYSTKGEIPFYRIRSDTLARHIVKIGMLDLYHVVDEVDAAPVWADSIGMTLGASKLQCGEEVSRLKAETVGDTDVSFYEILAKDSAKVARCLRNSSVAAVSIADKLQAKFPIYGSILAYHFQKGKDEKQLLEDGLKICGCLFLNFKKLPDEVKEKILSYLSFKDLRILLKTCGHLVVSH